jgi:histone deacetylase complex regulatory component SIN3
MQAVEFRQAKDYVKMIKRRFASEPHQATYKAFLKILHYYEEEQVGRCARVTGIRSHSSSRICDIKRSWFTCLGHLATVNGGC